MAIFEKNISDITEEDLQALIANQTPEQKTLDYKSKLPGNSEPDKKEFLADVSSFANTAGGFLIYGISENLGIPVEISGLSGIDPDGDVLRLDQIIREGIEPRLPGISIHPVKLQNENYAILIRIPQSYAAPHMVTYKGASRFYARQSNARYNLDVQQLRQAFLLSEGVAERIRDFRLERVARVAANEVPVPLENGQSKLIIHFVPMTAFSTNQPIDIVKVGKIYHEIFKNVNGLRYNIDGVLLYQEYHEGLARNYYQVFRNGCVEFVHGRIANQIDNNLVWATYSAETEIIAACKFVIAYQKFIGIEPPLFIMVTLSGVKNVEMATNRGPFIHPFFDRNMVLIPEIMLENYPSDDEHELAQLLKPTLDAMWNAGGMPGSLSYDQQGCWKP